MTLLEKYSTRNTGKTFTNSSNTPIPNIHEINDTITSHVTYKLSSEFSSPKFNT